MIEYSAKIEEKDFMRAQYLHVRTMRKYLQVLCCLALLFSTYSMIYNQSIFSLSPPNLYLFLCCAAMTALIMLFVMQPRRWKRLYYQEKLLHQPVCFRFDEKQIHSSSETGAGCVGWDVFIRWKESEELFLLYQSDLVCNILVKRGFTNTGDIEAFRTLLLEKIGPAS